MSARKIKKGDQVIVCSGSSKGIVGVVERVFVKSNRAIVSNTLTGIKHVKGSNSKKRKSIKTEEKGHFEEFIKSIHISNLAHFFDGSKTKVYFRVENGEKKLYARTGNKEIRSI
jgi:large subunit ribosomal protein L24